MTEVYEPAEDSDLLVQVLRENEPDLRGKRALDVGTGSGIVARALRDLGADVTAVDINPHATQAARDLPVLRGDLATALKGPFDVVAFNAPYLPDDPDARVEGWYERALTGGPTGVEVSERFVADLPRVLAPGGRAYLVVSSRADLARLSDAVRRAGLSHEPVGSARFFFEEVAVWRLTPRLPQTSNAALAGSP